jgi:DNA-directed RNA polymerase-3 subunit RPC5
MLELEYSIPNSAIGGHSHQQADNLHITQRTFTSNAIAPVTHMALAKLDKAGERLDIIPLQKDVLQMRPSFKHLHSHDEEDETQTNIDKTGDSNTNNSGGRQKPILFQKKESDRSANARRNSYAYKRASEESEEWIDLDIHGTEGKWSSVRKEMLRKVACANRDKTIQLAKSKFANRDDGGYYVKSLNYMESISTMFADADQTATLTTTLPNSTTADGDVDETAVAELASKLVVLLQEGLGAMIPYRVLRSNFHSEVSDEMLIMALSSCAVLVRGNFALKSSLAQFLKKDVMKEMRDLMLLLLNMHGSIQRERLIRAFETKACTNDDYAVINADAITFVLETMAKLSNGCWVSKVEDDVVFAARFPELASFHGVYWIKKKEMLRELVELYEQ